MEQVHLGLGISDHVRSFEQCGISISSDNVLLDTDQGKIS